MNRLKQYFKDYYVLNDINGILFWDNATNLPSDSIGSRTEQMSILSKISDKMWYAGDFTIIKNRNADVVRHKGSSQKLNTLIKQEVTDFDTALSQTIEWYSR